MSYLTASLLVAFVAVTHGQGLIGGSWSLRRGGKMINFAAPNMDLQSICYAITGAYSPGALSDGMGAAMKYFKEKRIPVQMAAKPGSGMACLYNWANQMGMGTDAANRFGDFYDTVIERNQMLNFFQDDPCGDPLFCQCGAQMGMDPPTAMARMATPMNDVFSPMGPLGMCVKQLECQKNPMSIKCVAKVNPKRNPMMSMMGMMNGMNRMGMGMNNRATAPRPAPRPVQQATDPMQAMISTMLSNPMMAKFVSNPMFAKTFSGIVQQHLGQLQASAGVKAAHPISPTMPAQPVQPAAQAAQTAAQPAQQSFNPFQAMTQQQQPQMPAFNPFSLFNMG